VVSSSSPRTKLYGGMEGRPPKFDHAKRDLDVFNEATEQRLDADPSGTRIEGLKFTSTSNTQTTPCSLSPDDDFKEPTHLPDDETPPAASTLSGASPISETQTTTCSPSSGDDIEQVHSTVEALTLTDINTSRSNGESESKLDNFKEYKEEAKILTESSSPLEEFHLVESKYEKGGVLKVDLLGDKGLSRAKSVLLKDTIIGRKNSKAYSKNEKKTKITSHYYKPGGRAAQLLDWQQMAPTDQVNFEQGYCNGIQGWVGKELIKMRDASQQGDPTTERHDPPSSDKYMYLDKVRYGE